ncbi:hypothetical protein Pla123a_15550 [Posidoniimonas polymericola]|uniref:Uncharacterized protein n=1 Tax=Posidoniimonas polymericola TaxID=2528002 RepID=A0A5C5YS57_9BACT|nr:hypothetical protein [Posidoniimonas polymericola]TWT77759.1 hypothetical protein Pla123a_15550 [Posidoniimonas polymericola]
MAEPSSPFDDADDGPAAPPVKRWRRPWWRWNIVTLFVALFVYAWVRELAAFSPGATWMGVVTLFFCWGVVPMLFVGTPLTTFEPPPDYNATTVPVLDEPHNEFHQAARRRPGPRPGDYRAELMLIGLRRFSVVMMFAGVVGGAAALAMAIMQYSQLGLGRYGYGSFGPGVAVFFTFVGVLVTPLSVILAAGVLYTLTVIADRLRKEPSDH